MGSLYQPIVAVHMVAGLLFIVLHGVSMVTAFQLRGAADRERVKRLLGRSQAFVGLMYLALLVLLVAGIAGGFIGAHWGRLWIWASLGILVAVMVVMWAVASPYYGELRRAVGPQQQGRPAADEPISDEALAARLRSPRPYWLALVGVAGLVAILLLMFNKPF